MSGDWQASPGRVANTPTYDGAVSNIVSLPKGDLLLVYRQSDIGHISTDGRVVARTSTDKGRTWSGETVVHDVPGRDTGEPSLVLDEETGRITLFDRAASVTEVETGSQTIPSYGPVDTFAIESLDHGRTWKSPTPVNDLLSIDRAWPFGGYVRTSNGLMTEFYSPDNRIEALFSRDGGRTWGRNVAVVDSSVDGGRRVTEPVPCAVTEDKVLTFGRDDATGDFFACRSRDGGRTWGDPTFLNPTGGTTPTPIWAKKTDRNTITVVWGDRDDRYVYAVKMSAQLAWQEPAALESEHRRRVHRQVGSADSAAYWNGNAGDFGYPTFTRFEGRSDDLMLVFYDEDDHPNLWSMALP